VYLLDTDICVDFLATRRGVTDHVQALGQSKVYISAVTIGELAYGAMHSARPAQETLKLQHLISNAVILPVDTRVSLEYGLLKSRLRATGQLLEDNDLFIASTALCHGLTLVTHDKGFSRIPSLRIEDWLG